MLVPTSVLLAVLVAAGLLALAPALVRRHDATERQVAERAQSAARVLPRERRQRSVPGRRPVNPSRVLVPTLRTAAPASGRRASGVPVSGVPVSGVPVSGVPVSGVPVSGVPASGVPASGVPVQDPARDGHGEGRRDRWGEVAWDRRAEAVPDRRGEAADRAREPAPDRRAREPRAGRQRALAVVPRSAPPAQRRLPQRTPSPAIYRRRRVLAALVVLNLVKLVGVVAVGPGFWVASAVTGTLLFAYLVHLRNLALADRRRRRVEARWAAVLAAQQAEVRREQARRAAVRREAARRMAQQRESLRRSGAAWSAPPTVSYRPAVPPQRRRSSAG